MSVAVNPRPPSVFVARAIAQALSRERTEEHDPTCPDCKGKGVDKHGFDCTRCFGEGVIDE